MSPHLLIALVLLVAIVVTGRRRRGAIGRWGAPSLGLRLLGLVAVAAVVVAIQIGSGHKLDRFSEFALTAALLLGWRLLLRARG